MKEVSGLLLQKELQRLMEADTNGIVYQSLSMEQSNKLARKITLLPLEYQHILFLKYYFKNSVFEIDKIFDIENIKGKLLYVEKMLSRHIGLGSSWIDRVSLEKACELALKDYMKDYYNQEEGYKPNYSKVFRRKLKNIKSAQKPYEIYKIIAKRIAIFILVSILGFSSVLAINVEAREKFFHWIMETFPKFSTLKSQNISDDNFFDLMSVEINYIPKGYELQNVKEGKKVLVNNYLTENNQKLTIRLFISSNEKLSHYDTENAEVEEFILKDSQAYIWKTDQLTYLLWYQDGIECHISGSLDKNEMIRIAENIITNK
ncbi:MAG: DUF4367 domain-containing protein [Acetivibrio sp.]